MDSCGFIDELKQELADARAQWGLLTTCQKFEHAVILTLTGLIAVVIALATEALQRFALAAAILTLNARSPPDGARSKPRKTSSNMRFISRAA